MADFEVNTNGVLNCANAFDQYSKSLSAIAEESSSILSQLRGSISARVSGAASRIAIYGSAKACQADMSSLGKAARQATQIYLRYENGIKSKQFTKNGASPASIKDQIGKFVIDNAGALGGFVSSISQVFNSGNSGDIDYGAIAKGAKKFVNTLYDFGRNVEKLEKLSRMNPGQAWKTGFKRFVGLEKAFKGSLRPSSFSTFKGRFYNNFSKQWSDKIGAYTSGGAKSFFAWAGVAVSGVSNAIENYKDAKAGKMTAGRAVAETVMETVVDTGLNLAVGAAVSAGLAAFSVTAGAPVLLVGATTAAVIAGANSLCKWITKSVTGEEKGLTETISDFVLDAGKAIVKSKMEIVSNTVKVVSAAGNAVSSFFKKIF